MDEALVEEADGIEDLPAEQAGTEIDVSQDKIAASQPTQFIVSLPRELWSKELAVQVLSPDPEPPEAKLEPAGQERLAVKLGSVRLYASLVISGKETKP